MEIKMERVGVIPCVDKDVSAYGMDVSYLITSILSRKDLIYGFFSCLLTL